MYMNSFTGLVEKSFNERFYSVVDKIIANKIPVAFLSAESTETAVKMTNKLRSEGLNIMSLVVCQPPPQIS